MEKVAVVIPLYKSTLNENEIKSFVQCLSVLGQHPLRFITPKSLDVRFLSKWIENYEVIRFDDSYFKSPKTYNKLLTDKSFYEAFIHYEYMLIYQLDAFVFEDQLLQWCEKGYDYIGAPKLKKSHLKNRNSLSPVIMNGGLSLRKVKPILRYLNVYYLFFKAWPANEDMMFSFAQRRVYFLRFLLKLPNWKEALSFSIEKNPKTAYKILGKLPFGCHAWERYNPSFWKPFIKKD